MGSFYLKILKLFGYKVFVPDPPTPYQPPSDESELVSSNSDLISGDSDLISSGSGL